MTTHPPGAVLKQLWSTLDHDRDDENAAYIKSHLRIVVAGGDGTVTWVLGCISDLGLSPAPAVAVLPLGTGNDLSIHLGWGKKFKEACVDPKHIDDTFLKYRNAVVENMDFWNLTMTVPNASFYGDLPNPISRDVSNPSVTRARFWNYFSIGIDAEATYNFHHLREHSPCLASSRYMNQMWYGVFSCGTGWFCGRGAPVDKFASIRVKNSSSDEWRDVDVPSSICAIILLNVQTYGGGRDIWGTKNKKNLAKKHFQPPSCNDGLIEVIGFKDGWHTAMVMGEVHSSSIHAKRLAQCNAIELKIRTTGRNKKKQQVYMQLDGEPWKQRVPGCPGDDDEQGSFVTLSIKHGGTSATLSNRDNATDHTVM